MIRARILAFLAALLFASPAAAQFADQATWAGTSANTGLPNNLLITVPNAVTFADILGVPIRFIPFQTNTGATGMSVAGVGTVLIKKSVGSALIDLRGGELQPGVVATIIYDGTEFQLSPVIPEPPYCPSIIGFGGKGDGVSANGAALAAAFAAASSTGVCISFPAGKFLFSAQDVLNLPSGLFSLNLIGAGQDATILYWPNAGNGLIVNMNDPQNSYHLENLSITTGATNSGSGTGFTANQATCPGGVPGSWAISTVRNVAFRGDDNNNVFYWWHSVVQSKVSGTNWDNVITYGSAGGLGSGFLFQGDAATTCNSIQHNLSHVFFNSTAVGFTYGTYLQGVTISQGNFTNGTIGIQVPVGGASLSQLTVSDSQFNTEGDQMQILSQITPLLINNNLIFIPGGHSGVLVDSGSIVGYESSFVANDFRGLSAVGTNGLVFHGTEAVITGNVIIGLTTGVWIKAGSTNTVTYTNFYQGDTCGVLVDATCVAGDTPASNFVGNAIITGTISGITTTTLTVTGVSFNGITAGQLITGPTITNGTIITGQLSGTVGGAGTYSVNISQTAGAGTFAAIGGTAP